MAPTRPNIIWVMTDQHRADLTTVTGQAGPVMPTLGALADRGTTFERASTSYPACVPARVSLLTGRFPSAHQVRQNSNEDDAFFAEDLLDVLGKAGYETFFSGKPHMHRKPADFDHFRGPYMHTEGPKKTPQHAEFDAWLDGLDHSVADGPTPFPLSAQLPTRIVDDALDAVLSARPDGPTDRPFFCWVSFPEPHNPYQAPEPYYSMFTDVADSYERGAGPEVIDQLSWRYRWLRDLVEEKRPNFDAEWRRYLAVYLGMLRMLDDQIARLFAGLGEHMDNTIVVFLADHGDYVGQYGMQRKGAGLSDALTRIPLIVAGPGVPAGEVRDEEVSIVDVTPTMCGLLGLDLPAGIQGRDLAPLLARSREPGEEFETGYVELGYGGVAYDVDDRPDLHFPYEGRTFDELNTVTQSGQERMVRRGDWKLIMDDRGTTWLHDLATDPAEVDNLAADLDHAAVRHDLTQRLARWMMRVGDDLPLGRYTPLIPPHNWRWAPQPPEADSTP
ncbi:sulfatase family protein [Tessaracoccus defluvii]|uniref:Sulfatase-like hydrolase/transferase n=1 Tax=Tessaracoccus defluvii TaxID=1285901 RepID=A0A7H0H5F8_9ACTN|nr:sulfatase-like hydrolase/transferase [Tessaracoccus defluvii]QNP55774.1 sulfatase-like hydrolase/transferase [Tessaracoccus defluvii]